MHLPRLNTQKRTKQLHDAEVKVLKTDGTVSGTIHTTKGEYEMQPQDNEVLMSNLMKARVRSAVEKMAGAVLTQAAQFFEATITPLLPDLMLNDQSKLWWMSQNGIECHQDGLRSVVKKHGQVLAESQAEIPVAWKALVEARLKQIQAQEALKAS